MALLSISLFDIPAFIASRLGLALHTSTSLSIFFQCQTRLFWTPHGTTRHSTKPITNFSQALTQVKEEKHTLHDYQ
ncbi:hypothetical protein F5H01DRAFT_354968 [Linnemannia elongata]|nr:hypothetical protein F5H01DRAFT_354968 [Linnemannia elongata]